MTRALLSRTLHKWLGLIIGLQLLLWTLSGTYMVSVDLDFIHGDSLVRNLREPLTLKNPLTSIADVQRQIAGIQEIKLRSLPTFSSPLYEVVTAERTLLVDASTGNKVSPLSTEQITGLAQSFYTGKGKVASVELLERERPLEIQTRPLPLWRVDFDDWLATSFYLHPDTGSLVTRRHRFWRWFDFLWMLHIMDYEERTDLNNPLLRVVSIAGTITVLSGAWLLYFSFRRRRRV